MEELRALGFDAWFNLGDRDLATHLLRAGMLRSGEPLSAVTRVLAGAMGVEHAVLPMTDDGVTTYVRVGSGEFMDYQHYLVARRACPPVLEVLYRGSESARPAEGVLGAIERARLVVVGPSNPVASVGPMLALPGVRRALGDTAAPGVAVTPVVSGKPIADPGERARARSRAALLASQRVPHTATGVAQWYRDVCDIFVLDRADAGEVGTITDLGLRVVVADTIVGTDDHGTALARAVLAEPGTAG
jgi:LPPG:FO 2-phospho-L-lactate transferase